MDDDIIGGLFYGGDGDDNLSGLYRATVFGGSGNDVITGNGGAFSVTTAMMC